MGALKFICDILQYKENTLLRRKKFYIGIYTEYRKISQSPNIAFENPFCEFLRFRYFAILNDILRYRTIIFH